MKKRRWFLGIIILATILCSLVSPIEGQASTTLEKLQKAREEKKKTEQNIDSAESNISKLSGVQQALMDELNSLNEELLAVNEEIEMLREAITIVQGDIVITQAELVEAREREAEQYGYMKERIRFFYERGKVTFLEMLFSSATFSDFLNRSEYIEKITEYDRKQLTLFQEIRDEIAQKELELVDQEKELATYELLAKAEQERVMKLITQTAEVVAEYQQDIDSIEAQLSAYEKQLSDQNSSIAALQKLYEQELALSKLAAAAKWRDISEVTWAEGDRYLLANLIYCEAGGEVYEGQLAVGAVVVNRMLSSRYPDTLYEVIYQRRQFSPVGNGRLTLALSYNRATASCYKAADEAMKGLTNVANCLYFRTPIPGITPAYAIGGHIFY